MAVGSPFAKQTGKPRLRNEVCEEPGKDRQQIVVQLGLATAGVSSITSLWKSTRKKSLWGSSRSTGSVQGYRFCTGVQVLYRGTGSVQGYRFYTRVQKSDYCASRHILSPCFVMLFLKV